MFKSKMSVAVAAVLMHAVVDGAQAGGGAAALAVAAVAEVPVPEGHKRTAFHFKETKVDGKKTGVRRTSVTLDIPVPSEAEVAAAFAAGAGDADAAKVRSYILDLVHDGIYTEAREQVNANESITQDALDTSKLSLLFIASLQREERRGTGISKETWEDFKADYITVMAAATGKALDKITLAADLFVNRLQKVKTLKPVLKALRNELSVWFQKTDQKEDFKEVYEFLDGKAETFITADDTDMLTKLGAI